MTNAGRPATVANNNWLTVKTWAESLRGSTGISDSAAYRLSISHLADTFAQDTTTAAIAAQLRTEEPARVPAILLALDGSPAGAVINARLDPLLQEHLLYQSTALRTGSSRFSVRSPFFYPPAAPAPTIFKDQQQWVSPNYVGEPSDPATDPMTLCTQGLDQQRRGNLEAATALYTRVFETDPERTQLAFHIVAAVASGLIYLQQQRWAWAAQVFSHALALQPLRRDARQGYARALRMLNLRPQAAYEEQRLLRHRAKIETMMREHSQRGIPMSAILIAQALNTSIATDDRATHHQKTRAPRLRAIGPAHVTQLGHIVTRVLRHAPWEYGVSLDHAGWVPIEALQQALRHHPRWEAVTKQHIIAAVEKTEGRLEVNGRRIRARYGHSIPGRLTMPPGTPPELLYHGAPRELQDTILVRGLLPGHRQYVHWSTTAEQAKRTAQRKTDDVVTFRLSTEALLEAGYLFFRGSPTIWLTPHIPGEVLGIAPTA